MKLNAAVVFTLILLSMMVGAGVVSAAWGYRLGREALEGITQPDTRPTSNMARKSDRGHENVVILKEEDILADVKARMEGRVQEPEASDRPAEPAKPDDQQSAKPADNAVASQSTPGLPLSSSDQGVTLEVKSTRQQGAMLVLDVSLRNESTQPFEFLYSFMNVTDDQGQALSVSTEGLPSELGPKSDPVIGEVRVPTALLGAAKALSLNLTDYPNQQLRLNLTGIPVVKE